MIIEKKALLRQTTPWKYSLSIYPRMNCEYWGRCLFLSPWIAPTLTNFFFFLGHDDGGQAVRTRNVHGSIDRGPHLLETCHSIYESIRWEYSTGSKQHVDNAKAKYENRMRIYPSSTLPSTYSLPPVLEPLVFFFFFFVHFLFFR